MFIKKSVPPSWIRLPLKIWLYKYWYLFHSCYRLVVKYCFTNEWVWDYRFMENYVLCNIIFQLNLQRNFSRVYSSLSINKCLIEWPPSMLLVTNTFLKFLCGCNVLKLLSQDWLHILKKKNDLATFNFFLIIFFN